MLYQTVRRRFRLGKLLGIPAKWFDEHYLHEEKGFLASIYNFFKTRVVFALTFPMIALTDTIASMFILLMYRTLKLFSRTDKDSKYYQKYVDKYKTRLTKNFLGFITSPLGLISPKIISFYFLTKKYKNGQMLSGGHLYATFPEVAYPKNIKMLRAILNKARRENKKVCVVGAGFSQGQQFIPAKEHQVVISMKYFKEIAVNRNKKTVIVGSGAIWGDIQLEANKHQLALQVMQASNVFSVGGSISTNIHGWNKKGTIAQTLRSITVMDHKGKIRKLKPEDELFGYVVGGFNQFGIILKAEIELTDNELLTEKGLNVKPADYIKYFKNNVKDNKDIPMHLYRLSLDPKNLLGEGVAVNYIKNKNSKPQQTPFLQKEPNHGTRFERIMVNLMRHFGFIRKLFWWREKRNLLNHEPKITTNKIMQPPIGAMFNHSMSESEWLQEFFIPGEHLSKFLKDLGALLMQNHVALLNATVRYVKKDNLTKMGYANAGDRFAVVLCFNQSLKPDEVVKTKKWVRKAIDLTLKSKGSYYLPYQAFASKHQFNKSYPTANTVYQKKQQLDHQGTFESGFSNQYLARKQHETSPYKSLLSSKQHRDLFAGFLDNILDRVDKDKLYTLLKDILSYSDTNREIYQELLRRIDEIKPSRVYSAYRIYRSLKNIKQDLSAQAHELMTRSNPRRRINGLVEIGYPGRFVRSMKQKLNISGNVSIINCNEAWNDTGNIVCVETLSDYVQSGFPRPYNKFVPLNDFDIIKKNQINDQSVDLVTCFIGLHHIPDKKMDGFLKSLNRIIRPGGSFLLVDHDVKDPLTREMATLAHSIYNAVMGASVNEEMHEVRNFKSLKEWQKLLAKYGFKLEAPERPGLVRQNDPTKNTMLRFVKVRACATKAAIHKTQALPTEVKSNVLRFTQSNIPKQIYIETRQTTRTRMQHRSR